MVGGFGLYGVVLALANEWHYALVWILYAEIFLVVKFYIAGLFYEAARYKGYGQAKHFFVPFLFGLVGYLWIIALPNRGSIQTEEQQEKAKPRKIASVKFVEPAPVKPRPVVTEDDAVRGAQIFYLNQALNRGTESEMRACLREMMEYPEMGKHYETLGRMQAMPKAAMYESLVQLRNSIEQDMQITH